LKIGQLPPVVVGETLAGLPGVVDVWYTFVEDAPGAPPEGCAALLSGEERERHGRFVFEKDRRLFLAARVLVRTVLSRYAAVDPADWRFDAGSHGRPHIAGPALGLAEGLHFNLSHAPGLVACAVSAAHPATGVDVERLDRARDPLALADRYFAPSEVEALRACPAADRALLFFTFWTLKESYIKARGLGLALPLDGFAFALRDGAVSVHFEEEMGDDAARWRFALFEAGPDHLLALGVDTAGAALTPRAARVAPFAAGTVESWAP
jgi:4'-phosphopantetheinyl transferase